MRCKLSEALPLIISGSHPADPGCQGHVTFATAERTTLVEEAVDAEARHPQCACVLLGGGPVVDTGFLYDQVCLCSTFT